ncbi:MAG TPA: carboxypeptidase regulatory-like domain-containing protein, partial [Thermomicrobiales bacterium]|nr:carboxypeptidase regulatory-like domain-containing protein [Thermomicrobiales bacterium]
MTGADGDFALAAAGNSGFLVAHKAGYAPAWRQLGGMFDDNGARELVLTPPGALAGRVVDEADRPVASADVYAVQALQERSADGSRMIDYLAGAPAREMFAARTDADGRFRIAGFPTNATAVLAVHFPGKALKASAKGSADFKARTCRAGKTNIQLVLEPEAIVRGSVTVDDTNAPVPAARLTLQPAEMNYFYSGAADSVASARDGSFEFKGLTAGSYVVRAEFGTNTDWVAEGTPVDVPGGRTNDGVRVKAVRGAPLDVAVIDADTRRPLPGIAVTAYAKNIQSHAVSDGGGRARFYLMPGDYRLSAFRQPSAQGQAPVTVAAGGTNQAEIELAGPRKISGLVRAPDGRPAAGASVWLVGGFGPGRSNVRADTNG